MENIIELEKLDKRTLAWDQSKLLERQCPICLSDERNPVYQRPDQLIVNLCRSCGLYYVSPSPSEQQLIEFYSGYWVHYGKTSQNIGLNAKPQIDVQNFLLDSFLFSEINSVRYIQGLKWCDIGCGLGNLLYAAQQSGAIAYGCDLDPDAVGYAKETLKLKNILHGDIFQFSSDSDLKFDIISMMDFFEHPLNIGQTIAHAVHLLAPNGLLALWTPNGSQFLKVLSPVALRVDLEHMQYITHDALHYIAEKYNLRIIHLEELVVCQR